MIFFLSPLNNHNMHFSFINMNQKSKHDLRWKKYLTIMGPLERFEIRKAHYVSF